MQWVIAGKLPMSSLAAVLGTAVLATAANAQQQIPSAGGFSSGPIVQSQGAMQPQRRATARSTSARQSTARSQRRTARAQVARSASPRYARAAPAPYYRSYWGGPGAASSYGYAAMPDDWYVRDEAAFQGYPMPMMGGMPMGGYGMPRGGNYGYGASPYWGGY